MNTLYKKAFRRQTAEPPPNAEQGRADTVGKVCMIELDRLVPNPSQPRFIFEDEPLLRLADSIRRYGILQPLSVRPAERNDGQPQKYEIIAGERRWRAAEIVGCRAVPCIIIDVDGKRSAELALVENIQREDLNMFEQAAAIASLIDVYGLTQEQAARRLSTSQSFVANKLRILRLTPKERTEIIKHKLTERHARALLRLDGEESRLKAIAYIAAKELNVSAAERYVDELLSPKAAPAANEIKMKGALRDLRFFYNSVDRAVEILKGCGIKVDTEKTERADSTSIIIKISH